MSDRQKAARAIMERFVKLNSGDPADIRQEGNEYRWTAPDGRIAGIGWEG